VKVLFPTGLGVKVKWGVWRMSMLELSGGLRKGFNRKERRDRKVGGATKWNGNEISTKSPATGMIRL
jgi:hypothetical protein